MQNAFENGNKHVTWKEEIYSHASFGAGEFASFVSGEVAGRTVGCTVEVNEGISHRILEGMVDGAAALVPDRSFIQSDGFRGVRGGRRSAPVAQEGMEREEDGEGDGGEECGECGA